MTPIISYEVYNQYTKEYDQWFNKHPNLYQSELLALKRQSLQKERALKLVLVQEDLPNPFKLNTVLSLQKEWLS